MLHEEGEGGPEDRSARALLAIILSAVFVSVLTQSLVNVVVPVIGEEFGASEEQVGWVITGYLLVFAIGFPLYGRVSDLYSLRRTFSLGLLGLAAGSIVPPGWAGRIGGLGNRSAKEASVEKGPGC
jgi:MFS family permease